MHTLLIPMAVKEYRPVNKELQEKLMKALSIILTASWQTRPNPVADPRLMAAAQNKAEDMAKKNYFSHTSPEGTSANANVRAVDYRLPDWYPVNANNVESIYAGLADPTAAIGAWLDSDHHRPHLTGEGFYNGQNSIGVGTAKRTDGGNIWVFISAPASSGG